MAAMAVAQVHGNHCDDGDIRKRIEHVQPMVGDEVDQQRQGG